MTLREKLYSGFFGFWVGNYRIGIMLVVLITMLGISGILSIPKESSPDIKFGIVQVGTAYVGVSPEEIDSLITTRIEKEIKSISGIDSMESSSRQGFSSIVLTLKAEANTDKVVQEIKDGVSRANIPEDALEPNVSEISTDSQQLFSVFLANKNKNTSKDTLMKRAKEIQSYFEGKYNIDTVTIDGGDKSELEVIILGDKLEALSISPQKIADVIRSYNQSFPIGNFTLDTKSYDLRIEWDIASYEELLRIPVSLSDGSAVPLGEFATIKRTWSNDAIEHMNLGEDSNIPFVRLNFNKQPRKSVFETAKTVRTILEAQVEKLWPDWEIQYGLDLADVISQDYEDLWSNSLQTIILVFACVFFFIGVKESLIAALSIPLAFLVSILTLNWMGLSLNFMTNFSLILSFGIAIDLTLVIIEETTKKVRMWYSPASAVLLAVNELKLSVISSTIVTLIVFVPMMVLPGIIGKFLAYIPITVFSSLLATLFLALSTNSSVFVKLAKNQPWYIRSPLAEMHMTPEEIALLAEDRAWKQERPATSETRREKVIEHMEDWYEKTLKWWMETTGKRKFLIWAPIIATLISFVVFSPRLIGVSLFPSDDSQYIFVTVSAPPGTEQRALMEKLNTGGIAVEDRLSGFPEIKFSTFTLKDNSLSIFLELTDSRTRKAENARTSAELEKLFLERLDMYRTVGLEVAIKSQQGGPPTGAPVSIKLLATNTDKLPDLKRIVRDFETFLKTLQGTKNVNNTSQDSPGEIVLTINRERAAVVWISPLQVYGEISSFARGVRAGTIKIGDDDMDIIVKSDTHYDALNIDKILGQKIMTKSWPLTLGSLVTYKLSNALIDVRRVDGDLTISVNADVRDGYKAGDLLIELNKYAENYVYPEGISYKKGGEFEANKELLTAVVTALLVSILLVFVILVLVFNSYSQPLIIIYTIILGLLGVNFGLWFMKFFNDALGYNMPMGIGFISLNGLVVTNAIILIDKINRNRKSGMKPYDTVIDGGKTRMVSQIVTAMTTVFGLLPTAFQDSFWGSLAWTVIWGTIVATILTLYCIPALYYEVYLTDSVKKPSRIKLGVSWISRKARHILRKRKWSQK